MSNDETKENSISTVENMANSETKVNSEEKSEFQEVGVVIPTKEDEQKTEITTLVNAIQASITKLHTLFTKSQKDHDAYVKRMNTALELLEWTYKKYKLLFNGMPEYVYKRDIYYCELGKNIGSEQGGCRPVVIIQNDRGNETSKTTMVAVITTHRGAKVIKSDKGELLEYIDENGETVTRKLNYYEVPIELEAKPSKVIEGVINLTQIYTVSKKRLVGNHVARVTEDAYLQISGVLIRMLDIKFKKK